MIGRLRVPRPATVLACVALIVALSGVAYAGGQLGANSVKTRHIKDGAVKRAKIANKAVNLHKTAGASGIVSNPSTIAGNLCSDVIFNAPGVRPGDVVAISVGGPDDVDVTYSTNTVPERGKVEVQVCNTNAGSIGPGGLVLGFVALR